LMGRIYHWDPEGDKRRLIIFAAASIICLILMVFSEMQVNENCVFGENSQWGFGQVSAYRLCNYPECSIFYLVQLAALLFALAPMWSIIESKGGKDLAKQLANQLSSLFTREDKGQATEPAEGLTPHDREGVSAPLLPNGEHSPGHSPNVSVSGSPGEIDNTLHPAYPSHLTAWSPSTSTFDYVLDLLLSDSRIRSASAESIPHSSTTVVDDVNIDIIPPSRDASRGPSRNGSQVDLSHPTLPPPN
jgi:hypothetical protein